MARRVLAIQLVPEEEFAELLSELRACDPEAEAVALAAAEEVPAADGTIDWRQYRRGELMEELRKGRFEKVIVAHGRDHYATRAYWRAILLARAVGAREVVLCEGGALAGRHGMGAGGGQAIMHLLQECAAGVLGLVVLVPLILGASVADLLGATVGARRQERQSAREKIV
jgi:hypothetical protein